MGMSRIGLSAAVARLRRRTTSGEARESNLIFTSLRQKNAVGDSAVREEVEFVVDDLSPRGEQIE